MRILMIVSEFPPFGSGIANVSFILRKMIEKKGYKIEVLSRSDNRNSYVYRLPGILGLIPFFHKAIEYCTMNNSEYDVVWIHQPMLISIKKIFNIKKTILTFHTTYYGYYKSYKKDKKWQVLLYYLLASKIEKYFLKKLSKMNEGVICTAVSKNISKELRSNGLSLPINIIPNGLEFSIKKIDKMKARNVLNKNFHLNITENNVIILSLGRLSIQKNPLKLIEFINRLVPKFNFLKVLVVGSGQLLLKLKKSSADSPNIHVLGRVADDMLPYLYQASNYYISLSCYEGLPLAVLDAVVYNLPVILSDIPSHRWLIKKNIAKGVLIEHEHLTNNIERLEYLFGDTYKFKDISSAQLKQFHWEPISNKYISLLKKGSH